MNRKETAEYTKLMEQAPQINASGLEGDYRALTEFNNVVLAGHETQFGVEFVTWEWVQNHSALWQGHYYGDDYAAVKQDFVTRSELIPEERLFSDKQLAEIYLCIYETLDSSYHISPGREELMKESINQIEATIPNFIYIHISLFYGVFEGFKILAYAIFTPFCNLAGAVYGQICPLLYGLLVPVIVRGINDNQVGELLRFGLAHALAVRGIHFQPISYFGRCGLERPEKPVTIPKMLALIEEQTGVKMRAADFSGGGAETPYCSFHASYRRLADGKLKALPRKDEDSCCCSTGSDDSRQFVANQWSGADANRAFNADGEMEETSALDAFLAKLRQNTFAVSGMVFQDAYNLDLERLRRCYICVVDEEFGMVPFCAYNLTDTEGRALYRK